MSNAEIKILLNIEKGSKYCLGCSYIGFENENVYFCSLFGQHIARVPQFKPNRLKECIESEIE